MSRAIRRVVPAVSLAVVFAAAAATGCALLVGLDDRAPFPDEAGVATDGPQTTTKDSGPTCSANVQTDKLNCGACGNVCASGMSCFAGVCAAPCTGPVYVSASTGNDAADGCSQTRPLKTIGRGIMAASAAADGSAVVPEVRVCKGSYSEFAFPTNGVALHGSYNCSTWQRTADFGYPRFDQTNVTTLSATGTTLGGGTVEISGSGAVDGFAIVGTPLAASNGSSIALQVMEGSTAQVMDNQIVGATSTPFNTRGIEVNPTASPEIFHNSINGGDGDFGAIGVRFPAGSSTNLHDNLITTGGSKGQVFGVEVGVLGTPDATVPRAIIRGNTIEPAAGTGDIATLGVVTTNAGIDIVENLINAVSCTKSLGGGPCEVDAIRVYDMPNASIPQSSFIAGNRIIAGGDLGVGIALDNAGPTTIVNNAIVALGDAVVNGLGNTLSGVTSNASGPVLLAHNTIYSNADGIHLGFGTVNATNNLIIGNDTGTAFGVRDIGCTTTSFVNNAFVGFPTFAYAAGGPAADAGPGCAAENVTTITAFDASSTLHGTNDVRITSSCAGETSMHCTVVAGCTSEPGCASALIPSWLMPDPPDGGVYGPPPFISLLLFGWSLGPATPCAIASGGTPIADDMAIGASDTDAPSASTAFDLLGNRRSGSVPSIGAYEVPSGSCSH